MKNKLYYILAILYVLMFGLILYINGVFTGNMTSMSNLVINVVFLIIIGILFLISFRSFVRLNRATDALERTAGEMDGQYEMYHKDLWPEYSKKQNLFGVPALDHQFEKYQSRIASHTSPKGVITNVCPIEDYINEDLLDQIGSTDRKSVV